ncbi:MAG: hypothetical protein AAF959_18185 [Cyanobacteria bacterium P01_D01_bin.56]
MFKTLCGPAAEEAGQILADRVRYWRWNNALFIMEQVDKTLIEKGITPQQIPLKTLMPIMEGISVEDESENLKAKWVNLISNAASGKSIHPKYIKLFSELNGVDAVMLDTAFCLHKSEDDDLIREYFKTSKVMRQHSGQTEPLLDYLESYQGNLAVFFMVAYLKDVRKQEIDYETVSESFRYLEQLNLMENNMELSDRGGKHFRSPRLTTFGLGFLRIVSEPKKVH